MAAARGDQPRPDDVALLKLFRSSHYPTLRQVHERLVRVFHETLEGDPKLVPVTARPLKTPAAIIAKLVREKSRLATIQDIAGTRVVVPTLHLQELAVGIILDHFKGLNPRIAKDSRKTPDAHGYRAVHVVVATTIPSTGADKRFAEIQVRTPLQDFWAQVVEAIDEQEGCDLKHGDGPAEYLKWLRDLSATLADAEAERRPMPTIPPLPRLDYEQ